MRPPPRRLTVGTARSNQWQREKRAEKRTKAEAATGEGEEDAGDGDEGGGQGALVAEAVKETDSRALVLSTWAAGGAAAGGSTSAQRGACRGGDYSRATRVREIGV